MARHVDADVDVRVNILSRSWVRFRCEILSDVMLMLNHGLEARRSRARKSQICRCGTIRRTLPESNQNTQTARSGSGLCLVMSQQEILPSVLHNLGLSPSTKATRIRKHAM